MLHNLNKFLGTFSKFVLLELNKEQVFPWNLLFIFYQIPFLKKTKSSGHIESKEG